jgi:hypothetical protein
VEMKGRATGSIPYFRRRRGRRSGKQPDREGQFRPLLPILVFLLLILILLRSQVTNGGEGEGKGREGVDEMSLVGVGGVKSVKGFGAGFRGWARG